MGCNQNLLFGTKDRIVYIDVAKGILIILLIVHHILDSGIRTFGISNHLFSIVQILQKPLIICYFMPAFFYVSGFCSNFNKDFKTFLFSRIKTLLLPAIVFSWLFRCLEQNFYLRDCIFMPLYNVGGDYWFLTALFWGEVLYYWLLRIFNRNWFFIVSVLLLFSFLGTVLNNVPYVPPYQHIQHVFDLCIFIGIGNFSKCYYSDFAKGWIAILVYVLACAVGFWIYGEKLPYVTGGFGTTPDSWWLHIIMSLFGTISILYISKAVNKPSPILTFLGRNTLVIYLTQIAIIKMFLRYFKPVFEKNIIWESLWYYIVITICTLSICSFFSYIIGNTKLKVVIGRF